MKDNQKFEYHGSGKTKVNYEIDFIENIFKENKLNEELKRQMINLFYKYDNVFSEKPG